MNIVFIGTADFAAIHLEYLLKNRFSISGIVSQPDKPQGRKLKVTPSAVSLIANRYSIPLLNPENISSPAAVKEIQTFKPDIIIVVAYGQILKENILQLPPLGCINVHASLLPKYRGAAPIRRAIMSGETETGITTMVMDKGLDTGNIILQKKIAIDNTDTYGTLHDKLADSGKNLLRETLQKIANNNVSSTPQDNTLATYAKKINKEEYIIDWNNPAESIHNLVRGLNPHPLARTSMMLKDSQTYLRIWESTVVPDNSNVLPGTILKISSHELIIKTKTNGLSLKSIQLPGKRKISIREFLSGYKIKQNSFINLL